MSKKNGNKKEKVEKVSKETKVEAADLDRLPVEALDKLDAIVPDADIDIFSEEDSQELPTDNGSNESAGDEVHGPTDMDTAGGELSEGSEHDGDNVDAGIEESIEPKEKKLVGRHPITKEPVYL